MRKSGSGSGAQGKGWLGSGVGNGTSRGKLQEDEPTAGGVPGRRGRQESPVWQLRQKAKMLKEERARVEKALGTRRCQGEQCLDQEDTQRGAQGKPRESGPGCSGSMTGEAVSPRRWVLLLGNESNWPTDKTRGRAGPGRTKWMPDYGGKRSIGVRAFHAVQA